jgi:hypothetical protein
MTTLCDPQLLVKFGILLGSYFCLRVPRAGLLDSAKAVVAGFLLGSFLGMAQCLATAEYISQSSRGATRNFEDAFRLSFEPQHLVSLVDPFYRRVIPGGFGIDHTIWGAGLFFGPILPFALGAVSQRDWWNRPVNRAITILFIGYAVLCLGYYFPPNRLSILIPIVNRMRWPMRWSLELCAVGPLLIGLAIDEVLRLMDQRRVFILSATGCALAAALQVLTPPTGVVLVSPQVVLAGHIVWWVLFGVLLALQAKGWRRAFGAVALAWTVVAGLGAVPMAQANRFSTPDLRQLCNQPLAAPVGEHERVLTLFRWTDRKSLGGNGNYAFNLPHQFGGRSATGYAYTFRWQTWQGGISDAGEVYDMEHVKKVYFDPENRGLLQLLRLGAIFAEPGDKDLLRKLEAHPDLEHVETTPWVAVYRHKGFREAAWFVKEVAIAGKSPTELILYQLKTPYQAICTMPEVGAAMHQKTYAAGKVASFHEHHDEIDIVVENPKDGFLVVNTTWHPDWKATANGRPVEIVPTNGGFMGIPVPGGSTQISLRFRPPWRLLIVPLTAGFWILLAAWVGGCIFALRKQA